MRKPPPSPHPGIGNVSSADMGRVWANLLKAIDRKDDKGVEQARYYAIGDIIAAADDKEFCNNLEATLKANGITIKCSTGPVASLLLSVFEAFSVSRGGKPLHNGTYPIFHEQNYIDVNFRSGLADATVKQKKVTKRKLTD